MAVYVADHHAEPLIDGKVLIGEGFWGLGSKRMRLHQTWPSGYCVAALLRRLQMPGCGWQCGHTTSLLLV